MVAPQSRQRPQQQQTQHEHHPATGIGSQRSAQRSPSIWRRAECEEVEVEGAPDDGVDKGEERERQECDEGRILSEADR
jgi:hypothetical protein